MCVFWFYSELSSWDTQATRLLVRSVHRTTASDVRFIFGVAMQSLLPWSIVLVLIPLVFSLFFNFGATSAGTLGVIPGSLFGCFSCGIWGTSGARDWAWGSYIQNMPQSFMLSPHFSSLFWYFCLCKHLMVKNEIWYKYLSSDRNGEIA